MTNSADPDQLASSTNSADPDQLASFRSQLIRIYTVRKVREYPGSAGLGLIEMNSNSVCVWKVHKCKAGQMLM